MDLARKLDVPRQVLIVKMMPASFDPAAVRAKVAETYKCKVAAVLPSASQMAMHKAPGLFVLDHPTHPLTATLRDAANLPAR